MVLDTLLMLGKRAILNNLLKPLELHLSDTTYVGLRYTDAIDARLLHNVETGKVQDIGISQLLELLHEGYLARTAGLSDKDRKLVRERGRGRHEMDDAELGLVWTSRDSFQWLKRRL